MRIEQAISSKAPNGREVPRGLSQRLRTLPGARAVRVIEQPDSNVDEHAHDWPVLSLYIMGSCTRTFDERVTSITGPCAVLHPAGALHASSVGPAGLEQIDIEFDPAWLRLSDSKAVGRVQHWKGGRVGNAAKRLSALWSAGPDGEMNFERATRAFIQLAMSTRPAAEPGWLPTVLERIDCDQPPTARKLAQDLGLHPAWLTQAYRAATGEGLHQTLTRRRVERAALLLRRSADPAAQIADEAGFCDQSHMIRCFRQLLGRTPKEVRGEGFLTLA